MARAMKEDEDPLVRVKQYVESHNIKVKVCLFVCLLVCLFVTFLSVFYHKYLITVVTS